MTFFAPLKYWEGQLHLERDVTHFCCSVEGLQPSLNLVTRDGALLSEDDPVLVVMGSEEVLSTVMSWNIPPLTDRYMEACRSLHSGICHISHQTTVLFICRMKADILWYRVFHEHFIKLLFRWLGYCQLWNPEIHGLHHKSLPLNHIPTWFHSTSSHRFPKLHVNTVLPTAPRSPLMVLDENSI
jgi:hypothetical protein